MTGGSPRRAAVVAALAAVAVGLSGCSSGGGPAAAATGGRASSTAGPAGPTAGTSPTAHATPAPASRAPGTGSAGPGAPGASPGVTTTPGLQLVGPRPLPATRRLVPVRVRIPAIGVDSTLQPLTTKAGILQPPTDPLRAGWWSGGPVPGAPGPAVIAGHLDSYSGPAVFIRLGSLHAGDLVNVTRSDGTAAVFVVDSVQTYEKAAFPTAAIYGPTPGSALRLITCGGTFDRARQLYLANVVVFASLRA